jgi:hypothetical protein
MTHLTYQYAENEKDIFEEDFAKFKPEYEKIFKCKLNANSLRYIFEQSFFNSLYKDWKTKCKEITAEELEIYNKIASNNPVQYTNTKRYIKKSLTVDMSSAYPSCISKCKLPIAPPTPYKLNEMPKNSGKDGYYLMRVNLNDLPPYIYDNKIERETEKGKTMSDVWWLHTMEIQIFTLFEKECSLVIGDNVINAYICEETITCTYKQLAELMKYKNETKNKIAKQVLNQGIGMMQKKETVKTDMNNYTDNTIVHVNSKTGKINVLEKTENPKYALFRIRFNLYPKMKYLIMLKVHELWKAGVKIYRIATDSITFSTKGKDITDLWVGGDNIFNTWKYEDKDFNKGYFDKRGHFEKQDKRRD